MNLQAYFRVSSALVKDDLDEARKGFAEIRKVISNVKSVKERCIVAECEQQNSSCRSVSCGKSRTFPRPGWCLRKYQLR